MKTNITSKPTETRSISCEEYHRILTDIHANGTRLVHVLDGQTLCDVEDTNAVAPRTGVIALA